MSDIKTRTLDNVIAVSLGISTWSGRKKLRLEDLKDVDGNKIPPTELASLGSKRIIDPKKIAIFEAIRRRCERALSKIGVRFMGGWAIPEDRLDEITREMKTNRLEFEAEKAMLLCDYEQVVEEWVNAHPGWEDVIRSAITPIERVQAQIQFDWYAFKLVAPENAEAEASSGLANATKGLGGRLLAEISEKARETWETSFQGKEQVTRKALRPIVAMREKMEALAFLNPAAAPTIELIDEVLSALPKTGEIKGRDLSSLMGLLNVLSDPDRIREHGQAIQEGRKQSASAASLSLSAATETPAPESPEPTESLEEQSATEVEEAHQDTPQPDEEEQARPDSFIPPRRQRPQPTTPSAWF